MGTYKYVVISYYLDGTMPKDAYFFCNIMKRNILTKSYGVKSAEPLQSGKWSLALIDFSAIDEALVPNLSEYILGQMHIYPFNGVSVSELTGNEALYINNLMFFKEKPDLKMHESYMKGYAGGYFSGNSADRAVAPDLLVALQQKAEAKEQTITRRQIHTRCGKG